MRPIQYEIDADTIDEALEALNLKLKQAGRDHYTSILRCVRFENGVRTFVFDVFAK